MSKTTPSRKNPGDCCQNPYDLDSDEYEENVGYPDADMAARAQFARLSQDDDEDERPKRKRKHDVKSFPKSFVDKLRAGRKALRNG